MTWEKGILPLTFVSFSCFPCAKCDQVMTKVEKRLDRVVEGKFSRRAVRLRKEVKEMTGTGVTVVVFVQSGTF